jgi:hypothetical protein
MRWIELFLTVVREGLGDPISLEFLLPHTGQDRIDILQEVDAVALYHYRMKVSYEDKLRRRFGKIQGQGQTDADLEDEATQALLAGVVGEVSFGELVQGDANELAAEESDEESEDESSSEFESDDGDDDDESNESIEVMNPEPIVRSQTVSQRSYTGSHSQGPIIPPPRPRALSLKSVPPPLSRNAPPVPPVPNNVSRLSLDKPLPRRPTSREHITPNPDQITQKGKKQSPASLKYPEIVHLQKLLPVFTEMVGGLISQASRAMLTFYIDAITSSSSGNMMDYLTYNIFVKTIRHRTVSSCTNSICITLQVALFTFSSVYTSPDHLSVSCMS